MSSLIQNCFSLLDKYKSGLSTLVECYITQGDERALGELSTLTLEQFKQARVAAPRNQHTYYGVSPAQEKELKAIYRKFEELHHSCLLADPVLAKRFGVVMALCGNVSHVRNFTHCQANSPDWLKILLSELNSSVGYNQQAATEFDAQWWLSLVSQSELAAEIWLAELLERTGYYWNCRFLDSIMLRLDWFDLLKQHEIPETLLRLHYSVRLSLVSCLQQYQSLNEILPFVITLASDNSKKVREDALKLLAKLDQQQLIAYLNTHYKTLPVTARKVLIPCLPVILGKPAIELLNFWLQSESSKAIHEVIQKTLNDQQAAQQGSQNELIIPPFTPLESDTTAPASWLEKLLLQHAKLLEKARLGAEAEKQRNINAQYKSTWQQQHLNNWAAYTPNRIERDFKQKILAKEKQTASTLFDELWTSAGLHLEPEFQLSLLLHLSGFNLHLLPQWVQAHPKQLNDIRQIAQLMDQEDQSLDAIARWILAPNWHKPNTLPDSYGMKIWPFFAEHDAYLSEAFELIFSREGSKYGRFELAQGMLVVAQFPVIPEKYLQLLYQHALSTSKSYGPLARQILSDYGVSSDRIIAALASSKVEERIVAANWIADLKLSEAIKPLEQALKKEKKETAIAVLLSTLHKLGVDISDYLSPKKLLKEAQQGLSKAIPKGLEWFPFSSLPVLNWRDGKAVDADIIKWWLVLACKLKQPEGNPLLDLYLQQLQPNSQQQLGLLVLRLFMQQDTQCPSDIEASDYAKQKQQGLFNNWQHWGQFDWGEAYRNKTLEDAYRELFNQKKSEYLGSAVGEKGILALASYAEAASSVQLLSRYMKDHYTRRAQIEAMLSALANSNDPVIIQLLLSLARRYRTRSVQEKAGVLVNAIAERNHWTHDELADRTIPTAGFENNGRQVLPYGSRNLVLRLDSDLKIVLENEDGKLLKALPAPRQNDDAESIKQAKADFSNSKKELQQVLSLQSARLYEAMCTNRQWQGNEWRQYLLEHPIMNRLLQQLVWQIEDGEQRYWVRPTAELELIDLDDEEHELSDNAKVCLAHISQLSAEQASAWRKHFKAEKISPLFDQFNLPTHQLTDEEHQGKQLDYHKGWLTDTFTLRGILTKRGYQRGAAEDGGFFSHYFKDFTTLKLRLIIEFSGNCLPEENTTAVLFHLAFVTPEEAGWISADSYKPLAEVPPNLLSEAMLDYEAVAAKASFDPDWQKKTPW